MDELQKHMLIREHLQSAEGLIVAANEVALARNCSGYSCAAKAMTSGRRLQ